MRLDRNTGDGRGKYGLVKLRVLQPILDSVGNSRNAKNMDEVNAMKVREAVKLLEEEGVIEWSVPETETEIFVLKLRDRHAGAALYAYSQSALMHDDQYANDVFQLARRAGPKSPFCKDPD